ncbi:hypothetical protein [Nocardioides marinquilinus]|uniref:hypothetical protein n=1 Tax=Nocardioides marinquilinus TaxID=1210400 RepID=UPI0031ED131A
MTEASVDGETYRTTCTCTCGWRGESSATGEAPALAAAARVRVDHLLDAHPRQAPIGFLRPRAAARYRHPRSISAPHQRGKRVQRHVACACGWTASARAGSNRGAARVARRRHTNHVTLQTGRTPLRDYAVMVAVVLGAGAVLVAMFAVAMQASGAELGDLASFLE